MLYKVTFFEANAQLTWHSINKIYEIISLSFTSMPLTKKKHIKITHMIYRYVNIVVFTCHNNYFYK